jgi:hypothetical protein
MKRNSGMGCFIFSCRHVVKDFLYSKKKYFRNLISGKLSEAAISRLNMNNWKFSHAYPESDMIWEDIYKDSVMSGIKTFLLLVLLLLISIVLLTPLVLLNMSSEVVTNLNIEVKWLDKTTYNTYLSTAMTMLMNVILIPFFIDIMVLIEDFPTKSERQLAILNRNFFFMLMNSLLLPLTGLTTIKVLLMALANEELTNWPEYLAQNLGTTYNYFITYFI